MKKEISDYTVTLPEEVQKEVLSQLKKGRRVVFTNICSLRRIKLENKFGKIGRLIAKKR